MVAAAVAARDRLAEEHQPALAAHDGAEIDQHHQRVGQNREEAEVINDSRNRVAAFGQLGRHHEDELRDQRKQPDGETGNGDKAAHVRVHATTLSNRDSNSAPPVRAAMGSFDEVFGMRHHAEDVALFVEDSSYVVDRSVGIGAGGIAEGDEVVVLDEPERVRVGKVIAVMMGHRHRMICPALIMRGEGRSGIGQLRA